MHGSGRTAEYYLDGFAPIAERHGALAIAIEFPKTYYPSSDDYTLAVGTSDTPYGSTYDPSDPMGKMFFNILATFAEFESDLIRMRTREGMAVARAKGKLRGKKPKLSDRQARELRRMYDTGDYSVSDLAEVFSVSRPTVYRTLQRQPGVVQ